MSFLLRFAFITLSTVFFLGCSSDSVDDAIDDAEDLIDAIDVERKTIDTTRMGLNAFANERFAGSICAQYREIKNTLGLRFVRVLFSWNNSIQSSPGATPFMGFYDDILSCIPNGVDALVVLTGVPSWMNDEANWIDGNPRRTFVERWVKFVANRYRGNGKIIAYQIGNEPNNAEFTENITLDLVNSPENFVELVMLGANAVRDADGSKLVVNGATTGIAQRFPDTLNYNKDLRNAGMLDVVDIFATHYYGTNFEKFQRDVKDFLNGLGKSVWITESGKAGVNNQLAYVERVWPFIRENVPAIDRIYYYKFAESVPPDVAFGLKTPDTSFPVSDLYLHLSDRAAQ